MVFTGVGLLVGADTLGLGLPLTLLVGFGVGLVLLGALS